MGYKKQTPIIKIEAINPENDELLFEVTNRNWTNISEVFNDFHFNTICSNELRNKENPKKILLVAVAEYVNS